MSAEQILHRVTAKWTGIRPLLMHNSQTVDPVNAFVMKIKDITNKGSKTNSEAA